MAGSQNGQQKKQQIFFRLTAFAGRRWRLVFSFESLGLAGMTITRLANKNFSSQIKKEYFHSPLQNTLYLCVLSE